MKPLFNPQETKQHSFSDVLHSVQQFLSENYTALLQEGSERQNADRLKQYIRKYLTDNAVSVEYLSRGELTEKLYSEMAEYSYLMPYLRDKTVEELNINAWNDIEVLYSSGDFKKLSEHFSSPDHALQIVRRMLHASGVVLDHASPIALASIGKNIRIAAMMCPIVDAEIGVAASIRMVNPQHIGKEEFIGSGTATEEMLDFLSSVVRYGVSLCIAGSTGSGKTTELGWLLTTLPLKKRIGTIESGSRELNLIKSEDGKVISRVVHTLSRESDDPAQSVPQVKLLEHSLSFDFDYVVLAEMRGAEAAVVMEAANTGTPVLTTIHASSCESTYNCIVSLAKRGSSFDDATLYGHVTESFPLIIFSKQLEDKSRKITEIMECEILPDNTRNFRPLYRYLYCIIWCKKQAWKMFSQM